MKLLTAALLLAPLVTACSDYSYHEYEEVDVFFQKAADKNDILFVIDNSASMAPYQDELGLRFNEFLSWFDVAGVDYRIAATTTDVISEDAGQILGPILTPDTADKTAVFGEVVDVGTQGNGTEMGYEAARIAILEVQDEAFLREEAFLSVVFVSDEQDSSPDSVQTYLKELQESKGTARDKVRIGCLVALDEDACDSEFGTHEGTRYMAGADMTGGLSIDICTQGFSDIVTDLSLNLSRLTDVFYLTSLPDAGSLEVYVDEVLLDCTDGTWRYEPVLVQGIETGAIFFEQDAMPPLGSRITARYNIGSGNVASFCL